MRPFIEDQYEEGTGTQIVTFFCNNWQMNIANQSYLESCSISWHRDAMIVARAWVNWLNPCR